MIEYARSFESNMAMSLKLNDEILLKKDKQIWNYETIIKI